MFAGETIAKGAKIWRFVHGFDRCYTPKQFAKLPKPARDYLKTYGYKVDGEVLFTVDNDHYINHADDPNTYNSHSLDIFLENLSAWQEGRQPPNHFDTVRGY